ncbi:MAG: hypothetical protein Q8N56_01905, partial [bacterium]|nr:hypothetical protein [bacterium]
MKNKKIVFTIIAIVLVMAAIGIWSFQKNSFSKSVLRIEILGPDTIEAGQKVDYILKYKNNSDIILTNPRLTFEYPDSSLIEGGKLRVERQLDDIYPGKEEAITFSARILGRENDSKKAQAWIEFQPKNLKAKYEVSTSQTAIIKFSPLTFELDLPSRLEAEKNFSFSLNYFSNIDYPLSQLRVKIDYPAGFEFVSSQPAAIEKNEWALPVLNKAEGGRIIITGRIKGDIGEQKNFKASLGLWQEGNFVLLKETTKGVAMIEPMIYLSQLVNGSNNYVANLGESLHYEVFFKNIGQSAFENLFLIVNLTGDIFDLNTLRASGATYHQGDNSLVWDWKKNAQLQFLGADEESKVEFWVGLKDDPTNSTRENLVVKNSVDLSPAREEFSLKVNTKLALDQKIFFNDGVFGKSGSLPPQVGQPTAFTITWQAKNLYNDLSNVRVKAVLSPGISLTGQLMPRDAKFVFDSQSREIIWDVGDLVADSSGAGQSFSFQVSLTPGSSQSGQAPPIIDSVEISGDDIWTQERVSIKTPGLNTNLLNDVGFI